MYIYIYILYIHVYIYINSCHFLCIVTFIMFIYFLKTVQTVQCTKNIFTASPLLEDILSIFWSVL